MELENIKHAEFELAMLLWSYRRGMGTSSKGKGPYGTVRHGGVR